MGIMEGARGGSKLRKSKDGGSTPGYEGVNKNKEGIVLQI